MEKLRWIFNLYDLNGCGSLTQEEISIVVAAVYSLLGDSTIPSVMPSLGPEERVQTMFLLMDTNRDGIITFEEFCDWCQKVRELIQHS